MHKYLLVTLLSLFPLFVQAADNEQFHYEASPMAYMRYEVRVKPMRTRSGDFTMLWNYRDKDNYRAINITVPPLAAADLASTASCPYYVYERCNGNDSIITEGILDDEYAAKHNNSGITAILTANARGAAISLGCMRQRITIPVTVDMDLPGATGIIAEDGNKTSINRLAFLPKHPLSTATPSVNSKGPLCGNWQYLDRNVDPALASLGDKYKLLILADGNTHYIMSDNRIKGMLSPSAFVNHYNLVWLTPDGLNADDEAFADYNSELKIITLSFPLLKSSVRFVKE